MEQWLPFFGGLTLDPAHHCADAAANPVPRRIPGCRPLALLPASFPPFTLRSRRFQRPWVSPDICFLRRGKPRVSEFLSTDRRPSVSHFGAAVRLPARRDRRRRKTTNLVRFFMTGSGPSARACPWSSICWRRRFARIRPAHQGLRARRAALGGSTLPVPGIGTRAAAELLAQLIDILKRQFTEGREIIDPGASCRRKSGDCGRRWP